MMVHEELSVQEEVQASRKSESHISNTCRNSESQAELSMIVR